MKKRGFIFCFLVAMVMLTTACTSNAGDNFSRMLQDRWQIIQDSPDPDAPPPDPVEIIPYDNGDFGPTLGFDLVSYPSHDGLLAERFFALDGWFGQIQYDAGEDMHPVLRVAFTDGPDLHTTYANLTPNVGEERTIDNISVRVRHMEDTTVMVYWLRGDFQYLLHLHHTEDEQVDSVIEELVSNVDSRSV